MAKWSIEIREWILVLPATMSMKKNSMELHWLFESLISWTAVSIAELLYFHFGFGAGKTHSNPLWHVELIDIKDRVSIPAQATVY